MNIYVVSIVISVLFLLFVLDLVRRQKLKEQYSLLWILFSIMLIIVAVNVQLVERMSAWLSIHYAPAVLFLFGLLFCFAFILHLTMVVTKLSNRLLRLTQEVTILKSRLIEQEAETHYVDKQSS